MKNVIRLYTTFIPTRILPWIVYLVYPLLMMAVSVWLGVGFLGFLMLPAIYCITVALNFIMFRGFEAKDPVRVEFLHTSEKGISLFRGMMLFDAARRFVTVCLIVMAPVVYDGISGREVVGFALLPDELEMAPGSMNPLARVLLVFALLIICELVIWVTRISALNAYVMLLFWMGQMFCVWVSTMIYNIYSIGGVPELFVLFVTLAFGIIYFIVVKLTYGDLVRREKEKYYDKY